MDRVEISKNRKRKMNMIRHDYIAAGRNVFLRVSEIAESNERIAKHCLCEQLSALVGAKSYEVNRRVSEDAIEPRWQAWKSTHQTTLS